MIALRLLKCLDRAETFTRPLDLNIIKRIKLKPDVVDTFQQLLLHAERLRDREVADALRITLGIKFSFYRFRCRFVDQFMKSKFYYFMYKFIPQGMVKYIKGALKRVFKWDINQYYNRIS